MKRSAEGYVTYEGEALGAVTINWTDAKRRPGTTHMFCPHCGKLWGAVYVPLSDGHHVLTVPCSSHGGGVFSNFFIEARFELELSREVLEHDFLVMFEWLDKGKFNEPAVYSWPIDLGTHKKSMVL